MACEQDNLIQAFPSQKDFFETVDCTNSFSRPPYSGQMVMQNLDIVIQLPDAIMPKGLINKLIHMLM